VGEGCEALGGKTGVIGAARSSARSPS
jgi:hypothetical protein